MTDHLKLKPCPFCGGDPETKEWVVGDIPQIKIWCDEGGCHVHPSLFGNKKAMAGIWNTRADLTPPPKKMRSAEEYADWYEGAYAFYDFLDKDLRLDMKRRLVNIIKNAQQDALASIRQPSQSDEETDNDR